MLTITLWFVLFLVLFAAVSALVKPCLDAYLPKNFMGLQVHKLAVRTATIGTWITVRIGLLFYCTYLYSQILVLLFKYYVLRFKNLILRYQFRRL